MKYHIIGKIVKNETKKIYILLNKPTGYITTANDQFGRKTVLDLVNIKERIVPVGRLDMDTSGALILSNDGDFVFQITHPKHEIKKTYVAKINGTINEKQIEILKNGVKIDDYVTKPAQVKILNSNRETSTIEIVIHEGKNRQVRKMIEAIGKKTIELKRTKIGDIEVSDLETGHWRMLTRQEVDKLINKW